MRWTQGVPEKLFVAGCETSKTALLHALWLTVKACIANDDEAVDLCLTMINDARKADGQNPIKRETIVKWVKEREDHRAEIASRSTP
jgi:hypothetical protein